MSRRHCQGVALPELLVAMAVGLAVTLFSVTLVVSSNGTYLAQNDIAAVEDAGRFALDALGRGIRQAAYVDWEEPVADAGAAPAQVRGLDARTLTATSAALDQPRDDALNGSDVLALRFAGAADGSVLNCAGFAVPDSAQGWSIFYVAKASDGVGELRCKYRGANAWRAEALVRGVESLQLLYGLDTDTPRDGLPDTYETASQIDARDASLSLVGSSAAARARDLNRKTHWKRVCAVRASLLVHGLKSVTLDAMEAPFHLFGPSYDAGATDTGAVIDPAQLPAQQRHRVRRVFAATFLMRNRPM